jgi:hypothetical protein
MLAMSNLRPIRINLRIATLGMLLFGLFAFTSCSRKIAFETSTVVPGAIGKAKIKKDNNGNYRIQVNVRNLAEPGRLQPPRSTYVVWIDTDRSGRKNLGQITSSTGLFSSTRKASLETVTSFRPTKVFITAEENADITFPGPDVVLTTRYF